MYVPIELLADDTWAAEDDKTGFLSVGGDSLIDYIFKDDQYPWPWCKLLLKNKNMINEDKWESSTNKKIAFIFDEWSNFFG